MADVDSWNQTTPCHVKINWIFATLILLNDFDVLHFVRNRITCLKFIIPTNHNNNARIFKNNSKMMIDTLLVFYG